MSSPIPTTALGAIEAEQITAIIKAAVAEAVASGTPALLDQVQARTYCGMSKSGWHRARSAGLVPRPVHIEGSGLRWKRSDLDDWISKMKPARRRKADRADES